MQESCSSSQPPLLEGLSTLDSRNSHGSDKVSLAAAGEGLHHMSCYTCYARHNKSSLVLLDSVTKLGQLNEIQSKGRCATM